MRYEILLINSSTARSRLEQMRHQFSQQGMSYTRVEGLVASQVNEDMYHNSVDIERNHRDYFHNLSARDVATYMGHRTAWQELLDSGADYAIIVEDDVVLSDSFNQLPRRISELSIPWNMIKLAEPYKPERSAVQDRVGAATMVRYQVVPRGCCAYVLTREAAVGLLERTQTFYRPLDVDFQWWWEFGLNVLGLKPYPVKLSHRLGRDMTAAYLPKAKSQRTYAKFCHQAKFWWLNRQPVGAITNTSTKQPQNT